jgi:hypothetical protein
MGSVGRASAEQPSPPPPSRERFPLRDASPSRLRGLQGPLRACLKIGQVGTVGMRRGSTGLSAAAGESWGDPSNKPRLHCCVYRARLTKD